QPLLCIPIHMLAVRTFIRSILVPDHPEQLVHDVIVRIVSELKAKVMEVSIYDLKEDIYLAEMLIRDADGEEHYFNIDASDAFAVALKAPCYVYVAKKVLDLHIRNRLHWYDAYAPNLCERLHWIELDSLVMYPEYDLSLFLRKAIEADEYELAAKIKKALEKKK
ncbi:MAG: bifunctional nuclease family protein, partial [Tannerella sp.]|nr:bifunctional nuclease family protein [Tannerella sp.]